ncbi:GNAT family N-acetyltransferase [Pseudalkalibacillus hwajinpoensis]|uniref:GNAT family N-acetyltransferase n=1 Tax=Guptibacillus hwajinpoensis TaxID=208199 RepID=UPI001A7E79D1|nr:GNAT family N-acetyltransferase [Pseudalkalibacillus hwajinpoensis]
MYKVKKLHLSDLHEHMLDSFERRQVTTNVWMVESNDFIEKEDRFVDDWSIERKREIVNHFKSTIARGGSVIVAEQDMNVIGFVVIEAETFGELTAYRELSYIHVSLPFRGMGIGRKLFIKAQEVAKQLGVDKLYIGAHPSVETQEFYKRMGCVIAEEIYHEIYQRETRDIQLEITL